MAQSRLDSPTNSTVKRLLRLRKARERQEQGRFLAEGSRIIDGFLLAGWQALGLYLSDDAELPAAWADQPVVRLSDRVAARLSQAVSPSGYLAEFAIPTPPALAADAGGLVLVGVADPGNVGTLVRSAAAFGLQQLVLVGGCDPWSAKVVQASAGALAAVTVHRQPAAAVPDLAGAVVALVARDGAGPAVLPTGPAWLVVGSEAHGLDDAWQARCSHRLCLPMPGPVESLNAGIAGAIAAFVLQGLQHQG